MFNYLIMKYILKYYSVFKELRKWMMSYGYSKKTSRMNPRMERQLKIIY